MSETAPAARPDMPLFYRNAEPVHPDRHAGLALAAPTGLAFARSAHSIPLMINEFPAALRSYPIVFAGPQHMPVAVTGLRNGENLFVEPDGQWAKPHHVPAYVRRYPFVLAGDESAPRLTLCIERDPTRVVASGVPGATPLFSGSEPGDALKHALAFCEQFQASVNTTRQAMRAIVEADLLVTRRGRAVLETGEQIDIADFEVVDEAKLGQLSDDGFLALRRAGALSVIYCHLASMNSWGSLVHQASLLRDTAV